MMVGLPHLSELHGAATHLAVVAIPLYAVVLVLRRLGGVQVLGPTEPWLMGGALVGVAASGATGLLVWGQAQTTLRGHAFRVGTAHFWIGIALAVLLVIGALLHYATTRQGRTPGALLIGAATVAAVLVVLQGYLGGRMTYVDGVGVDQGGEIAQTAAGVAKLRIALARGSDPVVAGRAAFSNQGLGCASCHGDLAQGQRGPSLAGGADAGDFRRVHARGLFPRSVVADADFRAVDAWLRSLAPVDRRRH
jgi:mono/diheme cytochrome c family protein